MYYPSLHPIIVTVGHQRSMVVVCLLSFFLPFFFVIFRNFTINYIINQYNMAGQKAPQTKNNTGVSSATRDAFQSTTRRKQTSSTTQQTAKIQEIDDDELEEEEEDEDEEFDEEDEDSDSDSDSDVSDSDIDDIPGTARLCVMSNSFVRARKQAKSTLQVSPTDRNDTLIDQFS